MVLSLLAIALGQSPDFVTLEVDHETRQALVYRPTKPSAHPPIIFGFHGHMGTSRNASRSFDLQSAWPEAVVVYPQGLPTKTHLDPEGRFNGWSAEASDANRDIRFFDLLYKSVMSSTHADPRRVFAMGHSNGGQFVYTLWAMRGAEIAGIGSFEGAGGQSVRLTPKPFFITIGSQDRTVPPALQKRSLDAVFRIDQSSTNGQPYGDKGMLYSGDQPVVLWSYDGGHRFPADAVPTMIRFFQSVKN